MTATMIAFLWSIHKPTFVFITPSVELGSGPAFILI